MLTSTPSYVRPSIRFEFANWVGTDPLPRDQTQSHRLHEPDHFINTIDPMTGFDIVDVANHPSLADGNLTIYFETEATRKAYLDMPVNHPNRCLPFPPADDDDRGG
jgi:hypothetical protein